MTTTAPIDDSNVENLPVIDEAHLMTFTEGDASLEDELAELYVNTSLGYLKRMQEALHEERSWSAEAHALKGASGNLGACRVAALAKKAEFVPPSEDNLNLLRSAVEEVGTFFRNRNP